MITLTKFLNHVQHDGNATKRFLGVLLVAILCFSSCKENAHLATTVTESNKGLATVSDAQPLPGGRAYWSTALGRFNPKASKVKTQLKPLISVSSVPATGFHQHTLVA